MQGVYWAQQVGLHDCIHVFHRNLLHKAAPGYPGIVYEYVDRSPIVGFSDRCRYSFVISHICCLYHTNSTETFTLWRPSKAKMWQFMHTILTEHHLFALISTTPRSHGDSRHEFSACNRGGRHDCDWNFPYKSKATPSVDVITAMDSPY